MPDNDWLTRGLDGFADQLSAQVAAAGQPGHEHAIHFCLALGLNAAWNLKPGSIIFEFPSAGRRIDVFVLAYDLAIEVKYQRPIPSERNRPFPQLFGGLLADFNKVAASAASQRLGILVADQLGIDYIVRNHHGVLAVEADRVAVISSQSLDLLSQTASSRAVENDSWRALQNTLVWRRHVGDWHLLAWKIDPI